MKSLSQILNEAVRKYSIDDIYHNIETLKNSKYIKKLKLPKFPIKVAIDQDSINKLGKNIVENLNIEYEYYKTLGMYDWKYYYIFEVKNIDEWLLVCAILNEFGIASYSDFFEGHPGSKPCRDTVFYVKDTQNWLDKARREAE